MQTIRVVQRGQAASAGGERPVTRRVQVGARGSVDKMLLRGLRHEKEAPGEVRGSRPGPLSESNVGPLSFWKASRWDDEDHWVWDPDTGSLGFWLH